MGKHSATSGSRNERKTGGERIPERRRDGMLEPTPKLRVHRERERRRTRRILYAVLALVVAIVAGGAVWAYGFMQSVDDQLTTELAADDRFTEAITPSEPKEPFTLLLIGSDVRPDEESARADTIILARVDVEQQRIWMLSIPRDTRVDIPGYGTSKINAATFHGGPALMVETVEEFLGVPVNHYMEMDFRGFQAVVDALGGVWIDVPVEIDDWKAASHSPGHRASRIEAGYQLLDGEYALTFVRSRDFVDADWSRMRNQQLFFRELAAQATRWENILKLPSVVGEFAQFAKTDMNARELIDVAGALKGISEDDMQTSTLTGEWRSPYVVTDEAEMQRLVDAMMSGEPFEPPIEEVEVVPQDVSVAVRNGGGISGIASEAADVLELAGFDIAEVGNANQFVYEETLVVYADESGEAAAAAVLEQLSVGALVPSRGLYTFSTDVLVVVGSDWVEASLTGGAGVGLME